MIRSASIHEISVPMREPFGHARAVRSITENVVVAIDLDGTAGAGECAPRAYVTGETQASVRSALRALDMGAIGAALRLDGFEPAVQSVEALRLPDRLRQGGRPGLAASCALELALLDAIGKRFARPLRELGAALELPEALAQEPGRAHPFASVLDFTREPEALLPADGSSLHHLKVKVGRSPEDDVARLRRVREVFGDGLSVAVDANMAWPLPEAVRMVRLLAPFGIRWYEEPLPQGALEDYRRLREETGARVMLDESLCSMEDGRRAVDARACDLFNIRISKCGGLIASVRLAALAHENGLGFQLGVQVGELGLLEAAARSFVATVRGVVAYEGVGASRRVTEPMVREELPFDPHRRVAFELPGPGLGVTLDLEAAERCSSASARWNAGCWQD